jgi:hypothetical protein
MKGIVASVIGIIIAGCSSNDDIYNANYKAEQFASSFEKNIGKINPNQNWNLFSSRTVAFDVNGESDKDYTLSVCAGNPATSKKAALLYQTTAKGNAAINTNLTVASALQTLYTVRTSADGKQFVSPLHLDGNSFSGAPSKMAKRSMRRSSAVITGDPFTFEDTSGYYDDYDHPVNVPAGAVDGKDITPANAYLHQNDAVIALNDNDYTYSFHFWSGVRDIYVVGQNNKLKVTSAASINQARIHLIGSISFELEIDDDAYINDLIIYVGAYATLNYNASRLYRQTGGGKIYNKGWLNLKRDLLLGNGAVIYNEGGLFADGNINSSPGSQPSFIYNFADMHVSESFEQNSTSHFYNEGSVYINGNSSVTMSNCWWINKGHYTVSENMYFSAGNGTFYNYCTLNILGHLQMYDGSFTVMDGGYVKAQTADFMNFSVSMGSNAAFYVWGGSNWQAQGSGIYQGFKTNSGATNALVVLGGETTVDRHKNTFALSGDITYAISNITPEIGIGDGDYPTQVYGTETNGVNFDELELTEPSSTAFMAAKATDLKQAKRPARVAAPYTPSEVTECSATWNIGGGIIIEPAVYTVAFEDLGSIGDFDFNDVVLRVSHNVNTNKATVDLVSAGGMILSTVRFGESVLFTTAGHSMQTNNSVKETAEIDFTGIEQLKNFSITTSEGNHTSTFVSSATETGTAPQALIIPDEWAWPTERTNINDAYPNFKNWVEDITNLDWYTTPVENKIVQ